MPYQFDFLYFNNISWFYHKKSFGNLRKKLKKESINLFHPYALFINKDYRLNYDTIHHLRLHSYYLSLPLNKLENLKLSHQGSIFKLSGHMAWEEINSNPNERISVVWSPHHTIGLDSPAGLSTFIETSEFILSVVDEYPQIDFILKPHPLLFEYAIDMNSKLSQLLNDFFSIWEGEKQL
jgi:hypothetical protein